MTFLDAKQPRGPDQYGLTGAACANTAARERLDGLMHRRPNRAERVLLRNPVFRNEVALTCPLFPYHLRGESRAQLGYGKVFSVLKRRGMDRTVVG